jgi:hypothetical protein
VDDQYINNSTNQRCEKSRTFAWASVSMGSLVLSLSFVGWAYMAEGSFVVVVGVCSSVACDSVVVVDIVVMFVVS